MQRFIIYLVIDLLCLFKINLIFLTINGTESNALNDSSNISFSSIESIAQARVPGGVLFYSFCKGHTYSVVYCIPMLRS